VEDGVRDVAGTEPKLNTRHNPHTTTVTTLTNHTTQAPRLILTPQTANTRQTIHNTSNTERLNAPPHTPPHNLLERCPPPRRPTRHKYMLPDAESPVGSIYTPMGNLLREYILPKWGISSGEYILPNGESPLGSVYIYSPMGTPHWGECTPQWAVPLRQHILPNGEPPIGSVCPPNGDSRLGSIYSTMGPMYWFYWGAGTWLPNGLLNQRICFKCWNVKPNILPKPRLRDGLPC
jgi:hypothetical protein